MPTLSIGMPVYNGAAMVRRAIDSLLAQSFEDFELFISDNSSDDETEEICRDYARRDGRVRYFRQPRNIGAMPNFEYVLRHAMGEFFFWAAHDDWWHRDFALEAIEALRASPGASGAMGRVRYILLDGTEQRQHTPPYRLAAEKRFDRVLSYFRNGPTDTLVYGVFRRSALLPAIPFVQCSCAEKLIIMHALLDGKIVDVGEMEYNSQVILKDHDEVAKLIGLPSYSEQYEVRLFVEMLRLLGRSLSIAQLAMVLPIYVVRNNWHKFFARWLLRRALGLLTLRGKGA